MPRLKDAPSYVELKIELAPYLIRYLVPRDADPVFSVNPKTDVGNYIMKLFSFPPSGWRPPSIPYERCLVIRVPHHYFQDRAIGQYISARNRDALAQAIEVLFWEDVYMEVRLAGVKVGMNERAALIKFREKHGISEEDFKLESMEKRFRRKKASRKIRGSVQVS